MKLFRKNSVAVTVFVVTVIISILLSGRTALVKEANKVEDIFYHGERGDGLSIYSDLKDIIDASRSILSLTQKVADPSTPELVELNRIISDYQSAQTPQEYYDIYSRLILCIDDTSAIFSMFCKDDTIRNQFEGYASIFASKMNTISYDPYNRYVREYEEMLESFPAGLIAKLTFVEEVHAFE